MNARSLSHLFDCSISVLIYRFYLLLLFFVSNYTLFLSFGQLFWNMKLLLYVKHGVARRFTGDSILFFFSTLHHSNMRGALLNRSFAWLDSLPLYFPRSLETYCSRGAFQEAVCYFRLDFILFFI